MKIKKPQRTILWAAILTTSALTLSLSACASKIDYKKDASSNINSLKTKIEKQLQNLHFLEEPKSFEKTNWDEIKKSLKETIDLPPETKVNVQSSEVSTDHKYLTVSLSITNNDSLKENPYLLKIKIAMPLSVNQESEVEQKEDGADETNLNILQDFLKTVKETWEVLNKTDQLVNLERLDSISELQKWFDISELNFPQNSSFVLAIGNVDDTNHAAAQLTIHLGNVSASKKISISGLSSPQQVSLNQLAQKLNALSSQSERLVTKLTNIEMQTLLKSESPSLDLISSNLDIDKEFNNGITFNFEGPNQIDSNGNLDLQLAINLESVNSKKVSLYFSGFSPVIPISEDQKAVEENYQILNNKVFSINNQNTTLTNQEIVNLTNLAAINSLLNSDDQISPLQEITIEIKSGASPVANDTNGTIIVTLTLAKGTFSKDLTITLSGFQTKLQADQKAVDKNVKNISKNINLTNQSALATEALKEIGKTLETLNSYLPEEKQIKATEGVSILVKKATEGSFNPLADNVNGTISVIFVVSKNEATSREVTVTINGFKTSVEADTEAIESRFQELPKTITIADKENVLPSSEITNLNTLDKIKELSGVGTKLDQTNGVLINLKDATNASITADNINGTISVTLVLSKGETTKEITITLNGFLTISQANQNDVNARAIELNNAITISGKEEVLASSEITNLNTLDKIKELSGVGTKLNEINGVSIRLKDATNANLNFTANDNNGTISVTLVLSKGETTKEIMITLSGFQTSLQADQKAVDKNADNINKTVQLENQTTLATEAQSALGTNLSSLNTFLGKGKQIVATDGVTISIKEALSGNTNPSFNDTNGTISVVLVVSKNEAISREVTVTITGFKTRDEVDKEAINARAQELAKTIIITGKESVLPTSEITNLNTLDKIKELSGIGNKLAETNGLRITFKETTNVNSNLRANDTNGTISVTLTLSKGSVSKDLTIILSGFQTTQAAEQAAVDKNAVNIDKSIELTNKTTLASEALSDLGTTLSSLNTFLGDDKQIVATDGVTVSLKLDANQAPMIVANDNDRTIIVTLILSKGSANKEINVTISGFFTTDQFVKTNLATKLKEYLDKDSNSDFFSLTEAGKKLTYNDFNELNNKTDKTDLKNKFNLSTSIDKSDLNITNAKLLSYLSDYTTFSVSADNLRIQNISGQDPSQLSVSFDYVFSSNSSSDANQTISSTIATELTKNFQITAKIKLKNSTDFTVDAPYSGGYSAKYAVDESLGYSSYWYVDRSNPQKEVTYTISLNNPKFLDNIVLKFFKNNNYYTSAQEMDIYITDTNDQSFKINGTESINENFLNFSGAGEARTYKLNNKSSEKIKKIEIKFKAGNQAFYISIWELEIYALKIPA